MSLNGQSATLYPNLLVKDLFAPGTREWNDLKVRSLVGEEDANKIVTIRPSMVGSQDKIRWMYNRREVYTVKSGYYLQRKIDIEAQGTPTLLTPQLHLRNSLIAK